MIQRNITFPWEFGLIVDDETSNVGTHGFEHRAPVVIYGAGPQHREETRLRRILSSVAKVTRAALPRAQSSHRT
jgi:hypothetical protein